MGIKHEIRKILWRVGYDVSRFRPMSHPLARRKQLVRNYGIDTVLDVGANTGLFAREMRDDLGYGGRIVSFEPVKDAFEMLAANAKGDPDWEVFHFALGDADEKGEINVAGNSFSSSLLDMLPSHLKSAPESKIIGRETIQVKTLDSIFHDLCRPTSRIYLKIDTQGFESKVLKGAEKSLVHIDTVQMEMSLVPLYDGELLLPELCRLMEKKGYALVSIEPGFSDSDSGQLLQVDGIFHRMGSV